MKGITGLPGVASAEYERAHPGVRIYEDEFGEHYAWKPVPGDELAGELAHGHTEGELLAKLTAAPGG